MCLFNLVFGKSDQMQRKGKKIFIIRFFRNRFKQVHKKKLKKISPSSCNINEVEFIFAIPFGKEELPSIKIWLFLTKMARSSRG